MTSSPRGAWRPKKGQFIWVRRRKTRVPAEPPVDRSPRFSAFCSLQASNWLDKAGPRGRA